MVHWESRTDNAVTHRDGLLVGNKPPPASSSLFASFALNLVESY